jgi:Response regulator containing CheY-like receiver domain and AraC-type DNA-binding domain
MSKAGDGAPPPLILVGTELDGAPGYCRIVLVQRGALALRDSSSGAAPERTLLPRSALLASPRALFRLTPGKNAQAAAVAFGRSALEPESLGAEAGELLGILGGDERALRLARLPPAAFDEAWAIQARLADELEDRAPGAEVMRRLRLAEMLMLFYRAWRSGSQYAVSGSDEAARRFRPEEAVAFVKERYAEQLDLGAIAQRFGLNPSYLSRAFARYTGLPLVRYINRLRIEKSCALLKRSSMSVLDIAYSVGYGNLSLFNRYFRRTMGMSPREYRRWGEK